MGREGPRRTCKIRGIWNKTTRKNILPRGLQFDAVLDLSNSTFRALPCAQGSIVGKSPRGKFWFSAGLGEMHERLRSSLTKHYLLRYAPREHVAPMECNSATLPTPDIHHSYLTSEPEDTTERRPTEKTSNAQQGRKRWRRLSSPVLRASLGAIERPRDSLDDVIEDGMRRSACVVFC